MEWFNCKVDDRSKVVGGARIETPDGYVFPLSIESVWFTCMPAGFLLMITSSNTPMFSSHHLTFWRHLFWTMILHLPFIRKFTKKLMIPCSQILCLMNLGIFTSEWYSIPPETGEHTFMPISTRLTLLRLIGNPSGPTLNGNLNKSSKIHTRLPQGSEVLSLNMITSRNISSPGILFSQSLKE